MIDSDVAFFFEKDKIVVDELTYINGEVYSYTLGSLDFNPELGFLDFAYLFYSSNNIVVYSIFTIML